ncbi:MAG TPA: ABC transporter permease [Blastocatellia bacterium]|nr:ABC transporter permease [Blastocatellia bacterium]
MGNLVKDVRYGARMLLRRPGLTVIAVITLALGIGANTAIFSLVNTVLLRPLPVDRPEELVSVNSVAPTGDSNIPVFSYPNYRDYRDRNDVLSGLLAYRFSPISVSDNGVNVRMWAYLVSGNYFEVLGVKPALGRFFTMEQDQAAGADPVAVITYNCWQKRFGASPDVIGKDVIINGRTFSIIGVAQPGFYGSEISYVPEMWFPTAMLSTIEPGPDYRNHRNSANFFVQGRLKPGVTISQAEGALKSIASQLATEYPNENENKTISLSPPGLFGAFMRGPIVGFAGVLMAVVGLVLLLACTNLANLLLARATERRKEIAIRLAIGASRSRLIRQLLTESVLLALLGGAIGLTLAYWLVDAMTSLRPPMDIPLSTSVHIDYRVLLFTAIVSALTGVVFGLIPALQTTRPDLVPALKDETSIAGYRRSWLRSGLVVFQVSLSLLLLICAGLVLRGLQRAQLMNPGFTAQHAIELSFDLSLQGYDAARTKTFKRQLLDRVRTLPSIQYAGIADYVPLSMNLNNNNIFVEGAPQERGANIPSSMTGYAGPGYLEALGVDLLEGRDFTDQDGDSRPRAAIVNESFGRRFWPGESAVGKRFSFEGAGGPWVDVVGVVRDGKYFSLSEDPSPFVYVNLRPESGSYLTLIVRTASDPQQMIAAIRSEFQRIDSNLPVYGAKTMTEHMALPLFPARVAAILLGSFGMLALILAAIGIFGVMSYLVSQRTREIGIRMALGASTQGILRLVVGHGLKLIGLGMGIGLVAAVAGTRLMSGLLYGVSATDSLTFGAIAVLLIAVAMLACYLPARRATQVDPMIALRCE